MTLQEALKQSRDKVIPIQRPRQGDHGNARFYPRPIYAYGDPPLYWYCAKNIGTYSDPEWLLGHGLMLSMADINATDWGLVTDLDIIETMRAAIAEYEADIADGVEPSEDEDEDD